MNYRVQGSIHFPFVLEADVILDPNTADPDLLVSEDGKKLRAKEYTGLDYWYGYQWKRSKFDVCSNGRVFKLKRVMAQVVITGR